MMTICKIVVFSGLLMTLIGCNNESNSNIELETPLSFELAGYQYLTKSFQQWALPKRLREISGLALTNDQRLFAHNDESAKLFQLDYSKGNTIKTFSLGKPIARGDFEGLAIVDDQFYLVTSKGILYTATEGAEDERVGYTKIDTGLGKRCEVEGLTYVPDNNHLLMACKKLKGKKKDTVIVVERWSLDSQQFVNPAIEIDLEEVLTHIGGKQFNPSGIEWISPNRLVLIAARQRAILEVDTSGQIIRAFPIPLAINHIQTEGIAISSAGWLILADEGINKRGRIGVFRPEN